MDSAGTNTMARLARPRTETRTRLAVVADPHVGTRTEGTIKRFEYTAETFGAALADAQRRGVDAVVSPGDLTKDGEPWNYAAVDEAVADLDVPFYAVPGNHDVPKADDEHEPVSVDRFADRYGAGEAYPFHVSVGGVDLVGLNSAGTATRLFETHDGEVDEPQLDRAVELIEAADTPVVLTHYNLPGIVAQLRTYREEVEPEMIEIVESRDGERLQSTLAAADVPLVVTGHLHLPSADRAGPTTEVMSPATCSFPQAYLLLDVGPTGTVVRFVPAVDRAALEDALHGMVTDSPTSRGLAGMAATRLAEFPLFDDA